MERISVNSYITENFKRPMQQRIRLAIKTGFNSEGYSDHLGNKIKGYRDIFLDRIDPMTPRSKFLMGVFSFRNTGNGLFWLKYKKGLEKLEKQNET